MSIKTVIVSQYSIGGSFLYLQKLAEAFERKDYRAAFCLARECESHIHGSSCKFVLKDPSIPISQVKVLKYLIHLLRYLYNAFSVAPFDRHTKIVHLLFPFYMTDLITILRLKRKGVRVILSVHEILPHKPFMGGRIDMKIIKMLYESADLLLVHSNLLKRELMSLCHVSAAKIRVVPHGFFELARSPVDTVSLRKKYHVPSDKKVLLFFGSIRENKGLDILLNAMREMTEDFYLLIAGQTAGASEKPAEHYAELIRESGINNSVRWVNRYIADEECSEVFKLADAIVLPYKRTFHAQSGVLNLAIGYEKPCVVSDAGGIGETVRDYNLGVVVSPEDVGDLQRGIRSVFAGKMEFGFGRYKDDNSWDRVCDELISLYEEFPVN